MQTSPSDPTNLEILQAIQLFSEHIDGEINGLKYEITGIKNEIIGMKGEITGINNEITGINNEITGIKTDITKIKATMVTKDYLDDKLADLRGDLVSLIRKEDKKLTTLIEVLKEKKVIAKQDAKRILSLEPFKHH